MTNGHFGLLMVGETQKGEIHIIRTTISSPMN